MAAYYRVYDSRHLQADCQEPGSAPGPYARQSSMGYLYLLCLYCCVFCVSAVSRPIKIYTNESNKVVAENNVITRSRAEQKDRVLDERFIADEATMSRDLCVFVDVRQTSPLANKQTNSPLFRLYCRTA